ncbi:MAG: hypothetical protein JSS86_13340 [Cyanobacteria bacterium SZAS LIN-2]|nr:hypothetical protein [Cyanobacteria bacterium SZAS LIN-3]MBS1997296.1 hypothetical protein [Cyanobacteria bacterium SZAS LIN-2]
MLIALIVTNFLLAFVGAFLNRCRTLFTGPDTSDAAAALNAVIGTLIMNAILWLFFTVNAGPLLILSVTWPSFILGGAIGIVWNRMVRRSSTN